MHAKCIRHLQTNVRPEEARALKLLLLALSTSVGTFALTGVPHGPFTSLSPDEREAALRTWKHSYFALIRKMFLGLKTMTALTYFMATDEFERTSVAWRALRYPGPPAQLFEQAVPSFDFVFEVKNNAHSFIILFYFILCITYYIPILVFVFRTQAVSTTPTMTPSWSARGAAAA